MANLLPHLASWTLKVMAFRPAVQPFRNAGVTGSSPVSGTILFSRQLRKVPVGGRKPYGSRLGEDWGRQTLAAGALFYSISWYQSRIASFRPIASMEVRVIGTSDRPAD